MSLISKLKRSIASQPPTARDDAATPSRSSTQRERSVVEQSADLRSEGRLAEAVDLLAEAARAERDPEVEIRLAELRVLAGAAEVASPGPAREPWPPRYADPFPDVVGSIPEIHVGDLTAEVMGGAVAHHGSVIIRGLLDPAAAAKAVEVIEQARAHQQARNVTPPAFGPPTTEEQKALAAAADAALPPVSDDPIEREAWYRPVQAEPVSQNGINRKMVATQGGVWMGESPAGSAHFLEVLREKGVIDAVAGHFGERPLISLQKSTLRRSHPIHKIVAWHQDGSFLSPDVRTMNIWVAFSPCGGDLPSPGLEILPRRIDEVLSVDGALTPHSIPEATIADLKEQMATVLPVFQPGDAIMFDEKLVHRTHLAASMDQIRYALECWFFAPSHHTGNYTPLLV